MKLKDILTRIFDYNRNNKVDWYELLLGTFFMMIYLGIVLTGVIFTNQLISYLLK